MASLSRLAVIVLSLFLTVSVCQAADYANLIGFLVYAPTPGSDDTQTKIIPFSDIYWQSADGGLITTMSGASASFQNATVTQFVFLDEGYWHLMNSNPTFKPFRAGILDHEVLIPGEHPDITSDNDLHPYIVGSQTLDSIINAAPDYAAVLKPLKTALDADIAHYQNGERKLNGEWMSARDYQAQALALAKSGGSSAATPNGPAGIPTPAELTPPAGLPAPAAEWATADGKSYRNVVVLAQEDDGVKIAYAGGVEKIPYYELPLNIQKQFGQDPASLEAKKKAAEKALADTTLKINEAAAAQKMQQAAAAPPPNAPAQARPGQPNAASVVSPQPTSLPPVNPPPPPVVDKGPYPGSRYTYDGSLDVCYLESAPVDVLAISPKTSTVIPSAPGESTLTLRIITEGTRPEAPDKYEVIFPSPGIVKKLGDDHTVKFIVDGQTIPFNAAQDTEGGLSTGPGADRISFYLSPEQAKSIFGGKPVNFSVGSSNYMIDPAGISSFQKYFDDIDHLPPATSAIMRAYDRFLLRLPAIIDMISTTCLYILLSSFVLLVVAFFAGLALGMSRFMKL